MNKKININSIIKENNLNTTPAIVDFLDINSTNFDFYDLSKIAENANALRTKNSAYYTDKELIELIINDLPDFAEKESIKILEPSVGVGNFIPFLFKKYFSKKVILDVVDIDQDSLIILKKLLKIYGIPNNFKINYINSDFCKLKLTKHYDLAIGNPPFSKIKSSYVKDLPTKDFFNLKSSNLSSYFYEKCSKHADYVALVMPKNLLNTVDYFATRQFLSKLNVKTIIDFGEKGFKGVLVETIYVKTFTKGISDTTNVFSLTKGFSLVQKQDYIFDASLPYWIIYRNNFFDSVFAKCDFGLFKVFRDRQITSKLTNKRKNGIRIIKSRNISDDGQRIINLKGYDEYISSKNLSGLEVSSFLDKSNVYLTPNMTYNTRVMKKEVGYVTNGSVAILTLIKDIELTNDDLVYFSSSEFREFMKIARNHQTRTLNIDQMSIYFFGKRKNPEEKV